MNEPHFVIAKYRENVDWAKGLSHTVVSKDIDLPNHGREASSYLFFIVHNYPFLKGDYVFCQGNPFDHAGCFLEDVKTKRYYGAKYECDYQGCPNHCGLDIHGIGKKLGIRARKKYTFRAGAQFRLSAEEIRKRPLSWYFGAMGVVMEDDKSPWVLERLWPIIFNLK